MWCFAEMLIRFENACRSNLNACVNVTNLFNNGSHSDRKIVWNYFYFSLRTNARILKLNLIKVSFLNFAMELEQLSRRRQAVWPDWVILEFLTKVDQKHWWLFGLFWKGSLYVKTTVATFANIWATFLLQYLVTLEARNNIGEYLGINLRTDAHIGKPNVFIFMDGPAHWVG